MLSNEFGRVGGRFDAGDGFCTYRATGQKLAYACERRSIPLDNAHRALADVRATARLMTALTDPRSVRGLAPAAVEAPPVGFIPRTLRRDAHEGTEPSMPYLVRLAERTGRHGEGDAALRYMDLLDWAISDLVLDDTEHHQLDVLAVDAGLSAGDVAGIHVRYIDGIIDAALRDGVVDDREQSLITRAAAELGVDSGHVLGRIGGHTATTASFTLVPGTRVCFTGSAALPDGTAVSRDGLVSGAGRLNLDVVPNVTKKGCDLLVAADPSSQSGKAKKARAYGVPVVSASDFLSAGPGDTIPAVI
jgi:DNA polymerase-3 subunit epsilon